MQRWTCVALIALLTLACDDELVATVPDTGSDDMGGGTTDGGEGGDDSTLPRDSATPMDGAQPDGSGADMAVATDMLPQPDMAPPDDIEPTDPKPDAPGVGQVGTATVAGQTYLLWADGASLKVRLVGADGEFSTDAVELAAALGDISEVRATAVTDVPWVAWSVAGGAIHLQTADVPLAEPIILPMQGTPELASLGQTLLVAGQDANGRTTWVLVPRDADAQTPLQPIIDASGGLPQVDGAVEVGDGAVLRFSTAGQCLYIATTGEPLGNFPCNTGAGKLVGGASASVLSFEFRAANEQVRRHTVLPLFGASREEPFHPLNVAVGADLPRLPVDGAHPVIGTNLRANAGEFQLAFVEAEALWESATTFETWPLPNARAAFRQGARGEVVDFTEDAPRLVSMRLAERPFGDNPYGFTPIEGCTPTYETCDDADQDCDARADNGLCCDQGLGFDARIPVDAPGDALPEFMIADVDATNAYRIVVRTPDGWKPYLLSLNDNDLTNQNNGNPVSFSAALDGIAYVTAGGFSGFVGRDAGGQIIAHWHHPSANREPPPRGEHVVEGCADVLAVATLVHDQVGENDGQGRPQSDAGALLVCTDRLIKLNGQSTADDVPYRFPDDIVANWATVVHPAGTRGVAEILIGYQAGGMRLLGYFRLVPAANPSLSSIDIPSSLQNLPQEDLVEPIRLGPNRTRPPVQVRADQSVRVRTRDDAGFRWQEVLTTDAPARSAFAAGAQRTVTGRPVDANNWAFWINDIAGGENGIDLWSTEPTFTIDAPSLGDAPHLDWRVTQGVYDDDFVVVVRRNPNNDGWLLSLPTVRCREP